ncbi:MAG: cysteine desulfurase [Bacteriovoracaceae bacterium]|nr:cysteine desulfurase [Bacteriovoracaceae bacterium]
MIYADYNGSAPPCTEVLDFLKTRLCEGPFANPNASHALGTKIMGSMEKVRLTCAQVLGAKPNQILFLSGATEGISTAFHSALKCMQKKNPARKLIVISAIEHSAVLQTAKDYESQGYELFIFPVGETGVLNINDFENFMQKKGNEVALVSIMAANNETGIIQPYEEIAKVCQKYEAYYFSDTTQFIGKASFDFGKCGADFAVMSGHKIGALTGIGVLLIKEAKGFIPLIFGGGQEGNKRGGTQNYLGIETLGVALEAFEKKIPLLPELEQARKNFEMNLKKSFPSVVIIGENSPRLPSTTLIAHPPLLGSTVQKELEKNNIFVTTSSACSDGDTAISKVLKNMGISESAGRGVVRISLGFNNFSENYKKIQEVLTQIYS